jgi:ankyrin repeat protein
MTRRELLFIAAVASIGLGWVLWKVYSPAALLVEYSRQGNVEGATRLLNLGVDPNGYHHRASALIAAAEGGHLPVLELLLKHGADPLQCETEGSAPRLSALSAAAFFDHADAIEYLVKVGIPIEYQCGGGWPPPLEIASEYARPAAAAKLIEMGANPRRIGQGDNTYVMSAAWSADKIGRPDDAARTIELLVNSGCDVNARNWNGSTALMMSEEPAVVKMLLQKGADPHGNLKRKTPRH